MLVLDRAAQERLLGRTVRDVLAADDVHRLSGQRVLVTGAGGTVGAELSRQLAAAGVARLTLVDHSEYALVRIEEEIRHAHPALDVVALLCDVTRSVDIRAACRAGQPRVVYHAAAYKHVTAAEAAIVPAARVNVLGTIETMRAAREAGARFVLISSDKAAAPRSVMGATKRLAELVTLSEAGDSFRPIVIRFGNVLGSSGSVVEIMVRKLNAGLPIPITEPDATRYFMTASEAVALVLKADLLAERAEMFWLDMGEPIRIGDLADRMTAQATASGVRPAGIEVIGLRPGEKLREELTAQGLAMKPTAHERIFSGGHPEIGAGAMNDAVRLLGDACAAGDAIDVIKVLKRHVDDYIPSEAALANAITHTAHLIAAQRPAPARPKGKALRDLASRHRKSA